MRGISRGSLAQLIRLAQFNRLGQLTRLGRLWDSLRDLAFPPGCAACNKALPHEITFCPECAADIEPIKPPYCEICGRPMSSLGGHCRLCQQKVPAFDKARSLCLHVGPMARAVRVFKYHGRLAAGASLARYWAREIPPVWLGRADLMAPVPLHARRIMKRGFNQALALGRELYGPKLASRLLIRQRHTKPQVGLNIQERRQNVAEAFSLNPGYKEAVKGCRVILIDDVYTTGATVDECARVLKEAGAREVRVLTLARAPGRAWRQAEKLKSQSGS